jgi:hypothetical protein
MRFLESRGDVGGRGLAHGLQPGLQFPLDARLSDGAGDAR